MARARPRWTAEVRQRAGGGAAAGEPLGAVLGGGAEPKVCRLLAGVVVAGVAHGGAVGAPAQPRDDAMGQLVAVQVPRHRPATCPARPGGRPEARVAGAGDAAEEEPAVRRRGRAVDLRPVPRPNRLVSQPATPFDRWDAHRGRFADQGELLVLLNECGPGPLHHREREEAGPEGFVRRHRRGCHPGPTNARARGVATKVFDDLLRAGGGNRLGLALQLLGRHIRQPDEKFGVVVVQTQGRRRSLAFRLALRRHPPRSHLIGPSRARPGKSARFRHGNFSLLRYIDIYCGRVRV